MAASTSWGSTGRLVRRAAVKCARSSTFAFRRPGGRSPGRRTVRTLNGRVARDERGRTGVHLGMHARKPLGSSKAGKVSRMFVHPCAEALPQGTGVVLGKRHAIHPHLQQRRWAHRAPGPVPLSSRVTRGARDRRGSAGRDWSHPRCDTPCVPCRRNRSRWSGDGGAPRRVPRKSARSTRPDR